MTAGTPTTLAVTSIVGPPMKVFEVGSNYHQGFMPMDKYGWAWASKDHYSWHVGSLAVSSDRFYAQIMNNSGSGKLLEVTGVYIVPRMDAALVPATGNRLNFFRTSSSMLTTGSNWQYRVQSLDAPGGNVNPFDTGAPSLLTNSWITGRVLPNSSVCTDFLWAAYFTGAGSVAQQGGAQAQYTNVLPIDNKPDVQRWTFRPNEGLLIRNHLATGSGTVNLLITFAVSSLVT